MPTAWIFEDNKQVAGALASSLEAKGFVPSKVRFFSDAMDAIAAIENGDVVCVDGTLVHSRENPTAYRDAGKDICVAIRRSRRGCALLWHSQADGAKELANLGVLDVAEADINRVATAVIEAAEKFVRSPDYGNAAKDEWHDAAEFYPAGDSCGTDFFTTMTALQLCTIVIEATLLYMEMRTATGSRDQLWDGLDEEAASELHRRANELDILNPLFVFGQILKTRKELSSWIQNFSVSESDFEKLQGGYNADKREGCSSFMRRFRDGRKSLIQALAAIETPPDSLPESESALCEVTTVSAALQYLRILHDVRLPADDTLLADLGKLMHIVWHDWLKNGVVRTFGACCTIFDDDLEHDEMMFEIQRELAELSEKREAATNEIETLLHPSRAIATNEATFAMVREKLRPSHLVVTNVNAEKCNEDWCAWICDAMDAAFEGSRIHHLTFEVSSVSAELDRSMDAVAQMTNAHTLGIRDIDLQRLRKSIETTERIARVCRDKALELTKEISCPILSLDC